MADMPSGRNAAHAGRSGDALESNRLTRNVESFNPLRDFRMDRRHFIRNAAAGAAFIAPSGLVSASLAARAGRPRTPPQSGATAQQQALRVNGERLNGRLTALSRFGRNADGGIDRVAYSQADLEARQWVMAQMGEAGLAVRIDTAGNIIGRHEGRESGLPPLMTGSHIDSVPGGGNYDGQVGSMAAIECAHTIGESAVALRHPLEVIIFQNEENGKVGSKAIRGQDPATYLDLMTHSGKRIREGIGFIGGDPERLDQAERRRGEIAAFLELHIEQGAVLEAAGIPIGIVQGIVGIRRWAITVAGFANHAGTTPMDQRRDALLAAARFIDAVHRIVRSVPGRQVATVGTIEVEPGAPNVIPGAAALTLEMRDLDLGKVEQIFGEIRTTSAAIGEETGTEFDFREIYRTEPASTDAGMRETIAAAARELGLATVDLPSGAGHDAQEIALLAPIGMIFIPSAGGISHSPREFSAPADIGNGANVLLRALVRADTAAG